jgi:hypothetical protein
MTPEVVIKHGPWSSISGRHAKAPNCEKKKSKLLYFVREF